ncbi:glycerol-3-phosphate acyltransferase [Hazenella coriacea]|uniref:Acyl-phosphate glycerol 3-phosphate acyltransferase n=1 Tax=Hazenella coriacea TaxID=1179467 RepID=A0A4R3L7Z5_9BACL|nr:glycerol-3-phosphate acyltransferase [Hazenella coriacea]TCS95913.1 acyl-phosphate glycerol 3-phosphate acyltransferase [Hazenella coriacea]
MSFIIIISVAYVIGAMPLDRWFIASSTSIYVVNPRGFIFVIIIDIFKGMIATLIALFVVGWWGAYIAAIIVVLGSMYSIFLGFQGGKGIAVAAGALFIISPFLILIGIFIYIFSLLLTRYLFFSTLFTVISLLGLGIIMAVHFSVWIVIFCLGCLVLFHLKPSWKIHPRWKNPFR